VSAYSGLGWCQHWKYPLPTGKTVEEEEARPPDTVNHHPIVCHQHDLPCQTETWSFSNIIKCHTKTIICVLFSTPSQECVSNFAVYMLMFQNTTITKQNMRFSILESNDLEKPEDLIMKKTVLNRV
jgi:hypothetical protein